MNQETDESTESISTFDEIEAHRQTLGVVEQTQSVVDRFSAVWPGLLLAHRFNGVLEDPTATMMRGAVTLRLPGSKEGRARIGTDHCVFCSVGAAPYWDPPFVFLFGPLEAFTESRLVAPWDTRKATTETKYLGLDGAELVARYSFRSPEDRRALASILGTSFSSLDAYLDGERPQRPDPAGVWGRLVHEAPSGDLAPLHTAEARFEAAVELEASSLRAVLWTRTRSGQSSARPASPSSRSWRAGVGNTCPLSAPRAR